MIVRQPLEAVESSQFHTRGGSEPVGDRPRFAPFPPSVSDACTVRDCTRIELAASGMAISPHLLFRLVVV
jgi:hypothetical protein